MLNTSRRIAYEELELATKEAVEAVQVSMVQRYQSEWMGGVIRTLVTYVVTDDAPDPSTQLEFGTAHMRWLTELTTSFLRLDYHGPANFGMLARTRALIKLTRR